MKNYTQDSDTLHFRVGSDCDDRTGVSLTSESPLQGTATAGILPFLLSDSMPRRGIQPPSQAAQTVLPG